MERSYLHRTLALPAPRISFDADLTRALDYCLRVVYFSMDYALAIYAVSAGPREEKIANLKRWRESYFMNTEEAHVVDGLLSGQPTPNPLQGDLLRNNSYVALRLACRQGEVKEGAPLLLPPSLSEVRNRVDNHPLFSRYIELKGEGNVKLTEAS